MFVFILRAQITRVSLSKYHSAGDSLRLVTVRDRRATGFRDTEFNEFNPSRSHMSNLDGTVAWIDGVFSHERVTDTQGTKYGGDDDGHIAHDDRNGHFHSPCEEERRVLGELGIRDHLRTKVAAPEIPSTTPGLAITKAAWTSDASVVATDMEKIENKRKRNARM